MNLKSKHLTKWMIYSLVGITSVFLLISLLSYDNRDYQGNYFSHEQQMHNWCGELGAFVANELYFFFGIGAYFFVMAVLFIVYTIETKSFSWRTLGLTTFFFVWVAVIFSCFERTPIHSYKMPSYGGVVGLTLFAFFDSLLGKTTSLVLIIFAGAGLLTWEVFNLLEKKSTE